jgi:dolichol-phosphate mannosyltransferase
VNAEILFVDDWSPDGTANRLAEVARGRHDVRVIRRWNRRGLSSAVIEGMMATMAPVVAVIDGDGQHDEALLPRLFKLVHQGRADIAIGSRYCTAGSVGNWDERRAAGSRIATRLSQMVLSQPVGDPMSGFFAVRRDLVEQLLPRLSGRGFKILLDLLSSAEQPVRVLELPYRFRCREHGESKLGAGVLLDFLVMLADRSIRRYLPPRMAMFAAVGLAGVAVHLLVLQLMLLRGLSFESAQSAAVVVAIASNFVLNNSLTFRDRRLRGARLIVGLASFYAVCGLGALANIGIGTVLFEAHHRWWLSGIAGAVTGSIWNFIASATVTWRKR